MLLPGHRLLPSPPSVPPAIIADFAAAQVAIVSDNLNRLHGTRALRPFHGNARLIGTAITVKTRAGDNFMLHKAYELPDRATCSWSMAAAISTRPWSARS